MRVISQDGALDIPYEQVVIQRFKGEIYFLNKNLTGIDDLSVTLLLLNTPPKKRQRKPWKN